jgi:gamma-glutamyltranspeptidase / glutathione hydrolase
MLSRILLASLIFALLAVVGAPLTNASTVKPQVMGRRGVVAAGHHLAAEAGFRLIQQGGNAVDAGVAAVFAEGVVEQGSFGLGGEAPILIKLKDQKVVAINGAGIAPELATVAFYEKLPADDPRHISMATGADAKAGTIPSFGPLSAIVPGAIDSLLVSLENYGTKTFAEVIQPAVELAQGFPIDARLSHNIDKGKELLVKWPASARVFLPNGQVPKEGEIFSQPDLARTLQEMVAVEKKASTKGRKAAIEAVREYFYRGPVAKRISAFCEQNGCLLREGDFAAYKAKIEEPLTTNYRGVDVYKVGFWAQSPVMLENLNLLEGFDLKSMGQNSPQYIHTVVEAMKLGYADRDAYYGDPDFNKIPVQLISKEYANIRRRLMMDRHMVKEHADEKGRTYGPMMETVRPASREHIPGDPEHMHARASDEFIKARLSHRNGEHEDTTCVNVIDKEGNMFSATPSAAWLPSVIAGDTGLPLSQRAQSFVLTSGHPNQLAPHKRPRITLTPTIATKDGQPFLAFSTPGGDSQDQTLLQVFLDVVEFGMQPQEAVEAPRFNSLAMYSSFDDHSDEPLKLQVEDRIPPATIEALKQLGHVPVVQGPWSNPTAPTMIEYDPVTGVARAGADVRGHRYAIGW